MTESYITELYCINCNKKTPHRVEYISGIISKIVCEECGHITDLSKEKLLKYYTENAFSRVISKPERFKKEVKKDFSHFIFSLPFRLLSKPYRVAKEFHDIFKE